MPEEHKKTPSSHHYALSGHAAAMPTDHFRANPAHYEGSSLNARLFGLMIVIAAAVLLTTLPVNARPISEHPEHYYGSKPTYTIMRNGKKIGRHQIAFNRQGTQLEVAVETDITVKFLKIPVYRFRYSSTEIWDQKQLRSVNSTIVENKATRVIESDRFLSQQAGDSQELRFATNHWNPEILDEKLVFNTITGNANRVNVKVIGTELLNIDDRALKTTHYRYTGDLEVDSWYDEAGRWVKLRFSGDDGSTIEYISNGFNTG